LWLSSPFCSAHAALVVPCWQPYPGSPVLAVLS
jgi:hypothetical protein